LGGHQLAGGVGALAAGLGAAQSSDAVVVYNPLDVSIPETTEDYQVDLNGDGLNEFDIQLFDTITKVADLAPTMENNPDGATALVTDPSDDRTANLASGTLIGPDSLWGPDGMPPTGGDALNGLDQNAVDGPEVGHFQVSDGPGFIGVRFLIGSNTHYGWVGYEGTGEENDGTGHIFGMAYENTPDTAIQAGAGIPPAGVPGDYNDNGAVDAADYVLWRNGGPLENEGDNPGVIDQGDYDFWRARFGNALGSSSVLVAAAAPEPASLCLLAVGAAGLGAYRRRSR
jgi:hypothetical protein